MPSIQKPRDHLLFSRLIGAAPEPVAPEPARAKASAPALPPGAMGIVGHIAAEDAGRAWVDANRRAAPAAPVSPTRPSRSKKNVKNRLATRASFDAIASKGAGAGAAGMPEVKFLIDRQAKKVYFIPKEFPYHYFFARDVLGVKESVEEFNREAYLSPNRRYIAGTIDAYDNFVGADGKKGLYGISFWATDILRAPMILETFKLVKEGLPFAADKIAYHPLGQTQEKLLEKERGADAKALKAAGVPVLNNAELTSKFSYMALNPGKSFGTLRIVHGDGAGLALTRRDVVIYADDVPATLPPLAGVATPKPQTYLSHDALKARQDHTPYAYARDILADPKVKALEGKVVSFEITPTGYTIAPATQAEADKYLDGMRPKKVQALKPDLTVKDIRRLDDIHFADARAFGTKTTNVAELHHLHASGKLAVSDRANGEPEVIAPDGFGIPASFYVDFMNTAKFDAKRTLAERRDELVADRTFKRDPAKRKEMLAAFQEVVEKAEMPPALAAKLQAFGDAFKREFPGEDIRLRSSSDSEDLEGFNGAGLFDSYTFRWKDADKPGRSLAGRLQKVDASVWNERAYAEFDFYRIKPDTVAMSTLAMASTSDELANGVVRWGGAIPGWDTITINAQVGENLVTNPEGGATPDAIVVGNYGFDGQPEIQYEARTNQELLPGRSGALTDGEIRALYKAMKVIQRHFAELYGRANDPSFAIECEFKITKDGKLLIKQARPWVE